jgi:chorismate mutase
VHNLLLTGCGTSRYAAELGAKIMRDLDCFDTVTVLDSAEVSFQGSLQWCSSCVHVCAELLDEIVVLFLLAFPFS